MVFFESYRRVVSLQAWRSELLEAHLSEGVFEFFLEAQNDALTSHIVAQSGMWRGALQALRSCIENTLQAIYYKDHPIELRLWHEQRLTFRQLEAYFVGHPDKPGDSNVAAVGQLSAEYATLSRAVHASAQSFRMAAGDHVRFFIADPASVGAWRTREVRTLSAINLVLLWVFREHLTGTQLPNLRRTIGHVLSPAQRAAVRKAHNITIPTPS